MVRAKGVVTIMSGGPQVTSGLRSTSDPSDWRLYDWERIKETCKEVGGYLDENLVTGVISKTLSGTPSWGTPPPGGHLVRTIDRTTQAYRLRVILDFISRFWKTKWQVLLHKDRAEQKKEKTWLACYTPAAESLFSLMILSMTKAKTVIEMTNLVIPTTPPTNTFNASQQQNKLLL